MSKQNKDELINHQKRIKSKFSKSGLKDFADHNVLDLLLFYSAPLDTDTMAVSKKLLKKYGTIENIFDATYEALMTEKELSKNSALLLKLIPELSKYYRINQNLEIKTIEDSEAAVRYLKPYFSTTVNEIFIVVFLNQKNTILKIDEISQKNNNKVLINFSEIVKSAINLKANKLVVAHNHPQGFAIPSQEDRTTTERLSLICKNFSLKLCEHIVFSLNDFCLLSQNDETKDGTFSCF